MGYRTCPSGRVRLGQSQMRRCSEFGNPGDLCTDENCCVAPASCGLYKCDEEPEGGGRGLVHNAANDDEVCHPTKGIGAQHRAGDEALARIIAATNPDADGMAACVADTCCRPMRDDEEAAEVGDCDVLCDEENE